MDAAGVLPGFTGVAVHDCWSPYWRSARAAHALCGAHLLRELDEAAGQPGQGWAGELAEWLSVAAGQAAGARAAGAERLDPGVVDRLLGRYDQLLAKAHAANPPPPRRPGRRGRPKRSAAVCLLARLDTHRDEVCRFLVDLRVPFSNNQAERDIRMVKLQQKISGCWRTPAGAQARRAGIPDRALLRLDRAQARRQPLGRPAPTIRGQRLAPRPLTPLSSYSWSCL